MVRGVAPPNGQMTQVGNLGNGEHGTGAPALPLRSDGSADPRRDRQGPLRVLVIDRRSLTRDCLVAALNDLPDIGEIVAVAEAVDAASQLGSERRADVALVNLASDPFDGASVQRLRAALDTILPPGAIVLLTGLVDGGHVVAALRNGVLGILNSDTPTDVIIAALQLVSGGWTVCPPLNPAMLARHADEPGSLRPAATGYLLTDRQRQVLSGLQEGRTNRDIAAQLGISERAVKAHVQELMRRMGASNRTQIVAMMAGMARRKPDFELN